MISDVSDLKRKMNLILSQVTSSGVAYTIRDPKSLLFAAIADLAGERSGLPPEIRIADAGDAELKNEQVFLLKTLYSQCSPEMKAEFSPSLLGQMTELNASVIVHTVLELGHLSEVRKMLDDPRRMTLNARRSAWKTIREKIAMEPHRFTDDELKQLDEMLTAEIKRTAPLTKRPRP